MRKNSSLLNSPSLQERKRKKRKIRRNKTILTLLTLLLIIIGSSFLSKWQRMNIQNIVVIGNKVIDTKDITNIIQKNLTGNYYNLFSKKNALIYPKKAIETELHSKFPRLKDIALDLKGLVTLEVNLSERLATYTWCGNTLPKETENLEELKCYFMGETGYIFDEAPFFSGDVYFRFFGKTVGDKNSPIGTSFLPNNFENHVSFIEELLNMTLKPIGMLINENDDVEILLSSTTSLSNAPKIIFKYGTDLSKLRENLKTALDTDPLKSQLLTKYSSLKYIDLRFGNKVYYKFK